jgi:hypothetical protein
VTRCSERGRARNGNVERFYPCATEGGLDGKRLNHWFGGLEKVPIGKHQ